MSYTKERDEFLSTIQNEGMSYTTATKMLRYAKTLHRLAEAQCNGDYPADNGERKVEFCPRCEAGFVRSAFRWSSNGREGGKICIDCRTQELVNEALPAGFKAQFGGDPRGAVLILEVPSGKTTDWGRRGIYVPTR